MYEVWIINDVGAQCQMRTKDYKKAAAEYSKWANGFLHVMEYLVCISRNGERIAI